MYNSKIYKDNEKALNRFGNLHQQKTKTLPLTISFLVTNRCFLKCKHCFYHGSISEDISKASSDELSLNEYETLSKSLNFLMTGIFCGGEPFIREDFHSIINTFQTNSQLFYADSATNGQLTTSIVEQVEKILNKNRNQTYSLGFSIDGFKSEHDDIRGKGTFERAMQTWRECKILESLYPNFVLYICTTMNTINEVNLVDFIKWSTEALKPQKFSLIKIRQTPRAGEYLKNINLSNYKKCVDVINEYAKAGRFGDVNKPQTYISTSSLDYVYKTATNNKRSFTCYAGQHGAFIDYNGNVGACEVLSPMGNLRDFSMDFSELWNGREAQKAKKVINCSEVCGACTHEAEGILPSLYFSPNKIINLNEELN